MYTKSLLFAMQLHSKDKLFQFKIFSKMIQILRTKIQIFNQKVQNIDFSWNKIFVNYDQVFLDHRIILKAFRFLDQNKTYKQILHMILEELCSEL